MEQDHPALAELRFAINEVLNERDRIDQAQHKTHHEFIAQLVEDRRMSRERWEAVRKQSLVWGVIAALSGIGYVIYDGIEAAVNRMAHKEQRDKPE